MNYRLAGVVPAPEQLIDTLWRGVDGQFLIVEEGSRGEVRHGLVTFYERDDRAGTCGLAVALAESSQGAGRPLVGIGLAIDHWFRVTPARKIWVEVPGWNISRLRGISALGFELEGCRREQDWLDGRHWDRHLYAVQVELVGRATAAAFGGPESTSRVRTGLEPQRERTRSDQAPTRGTTSRPPWSMPMGNNPRPWTNDGLLRLAASSTSSPRATSCSSPSGDDVDEVCWPRAVAAAP